MGRSVKTTSESWAVGDDASNQGLFALIEQIARRQDRVPPGKEMFLLPVMIPGGPYSEDHESRVRSRFAIVSALGQSDFVPEDAEHLGTLRIPWPSAGQIAAAEKDHREAQG